MMSHESISATVLPKSEISPMMSDELISPTLSDKFVTPADIVMKKATE